MSLTKFITNKYFLWQLVLAGAFVFLLLFGAYHSLGWVTNHSERIEVPDLYKKTAEEAENILDDINLEFVVQDSAEYNPDFPKGAVVKQMPLPGDIVKSDRKIYVTLNASGHKLVTIPEFLGKTKRNIESTLHAMGIEVSEKAIYVPDLGKDVVRGMKFQGKDVKKGDKIPKTSVVTLVLGEGAPAEVTNDSLSNNPSNIDLNDNPF